MHKITISPSIRDIPGIDDDLGSPKGEVFGAVQVVDHAGVMHWGVFDLVVLQARLLDYFEHLEQGSGEGDLGVGFEELEEFLFCEHFVG